MNLQMFYLILYYFKKNFILRRKKTKKNPPHQTQLATVSKTKITIRKYSFRESLLRKVTLRHLLM